MTASWRVECNTMNRKKKLNDAFNKKLKKLNAKLRITNKPKYISKADRENIALAESQLQNGENRENIESWNLAHHLKSRGLFKWTQK